MRVLCLMRYSRMAASSRLRVMQYIELMVERKICGRVDYLEVYSDAYLKILYKRGRGSLAAALGVWGIVRRGFQLLFKDIASYDVVVCHCDPLPWMPFWVESLLLYRRSRRVVLDVDDAMWYSYSKIGALKTKYPQIMSTCSHVVAGNEHLAAFARQFSSSVSVIPTVVEMSRYSAKTVYVPVRDDCFTIGWIGTPATAGHLRNLGGVLRRLSCLRRIVVQCVGAPEGFQLDGVEVEVIPWVDGSEGEQILGFDVGVMPLPDDSFAWGKSGLKLIQYMASGVPAVGSAIGANMDIIQHEVNGMLAADECEFFDCLQRLIASEALRRRLGEEGRKTVLKKYCLQATLPHFSKILQGGLVDQPGQAE